MSSRRKRRPKPRKSRAKKRAKFLSLRLQFPPNQNTEIERSTGTAARPNGNSDKVNLLSVNQVEDRESQDHENVAFFFSAAEGGATSLTGLLDSSTGHDSNSSLTKNYCSRIDNLSPSSGSLSYGYSEERVRKALRSREGESREEKWVSYSEVVERKVKEEEVSSSAAGIGGPWLKLDYNEIINAWSGKGPLYVDAENSQIVPDINNQFHWGCSNVGVWTVPEIVGNMENGKEMKMMMMGQREASVLRYKEKRRNRLFGNKIRYQVRKLNAEKRPRLKGRFVKKS